MIDQNWASIDHTHLSDPLEMFREMPQSKRSSLKDRFLVHKQNLVQQGVCRIPAQHSGSNNTEW